MNDKTARGVYGIKNIDNWSLWFDFKILARTALVVLKGTGV